MVVMIMETIVTITVTIAIVSVNWNLKCFSLCSLSEELHTGLLRVSLAFFRGVRSLYYWGFSISIPLGTINLHVRGSLFLWG
jgi:hypothetical protein